MAPLEHATSTRPNPRSNITTSAPLAIGKCAMAWCVSRSKTVRVSLPSHDRKARWRSASIAMPWFPRQPSTRYRSTTVSVAGSITTRVGRIGLPAFGDVGNAFDARYVTDGLDHRIRREIYDVEEAGAEMGREQVVVVLIDCQIVEALARRPRELLRKGAPAAPPPAMPAALPPDTPTPTEATSVMAEKNRSDGSTEPVMKAHDVRLRASRANRASPTPSSTRCPSPTLRRLPGGHPSWPA